MSNDNEPISTSTQPIATAPLGTDAKSSDFLLKPEERRNLALIYAALAADLIEKVGTETEQESLAVRFHRYVHAGKSAYEWLSDSANLAALNVVASRIVESKGAKIEEPDSKQWNDRGLDAVFLSLFKEYTKLKYASPYDPIVPQAAW